MRVRRGGRDGFTLVELIVSTGVMMVAMLLTTRLLLESQIEVRRRVAELSGSQPAYATSCLRHDAEGAGGVIALSDEWRSEGMRLLAAGGGRVVGRLRDDLLERPRLDAEAQIASQQVLMRDVVGWHWRRIAPRVIAWRPAVEGA